MSTFRQITLTILCLFAIAISYYFGFHIGKNEAVNDSRKAMLDMIYMKTIDTNVPDSLWQEVLGESGRFGWSVDIQNEKEHVFEFHKEFKFQLIEDESEEESKPE